MFRALRWRLLAAYLAVMTATLSVSAIAVYIFFERSLRQQLDNRLLTLAQATVPSLSEVKTQGGRYLNELDTAFARDLWLEAVLATDAGADLEPDFEPSLGLRPSSEGAGLGVPSPGSPSQLDLDQLDPNQPDPNQPDSETTQADRQTDPISLDRLRTLFAPADPLVLPTGLSDPSAEGAAWRELFRRNQQSLRWLDADGSELASRGLLRIESQPSVGFATLDQDTIRTLVVPVYGSETNGEQALEGYIQASESTAAIRAALRQLQWGFGAGGALALVLSGLGGIWLTQKALKPVEASFRRLTQFTADASHELRSPLTAIHTSLSVMARHPERFDPRDQQKVTVMLSATRQLNQLATDLLWLARLDGVAPQTVKQTWVAVNLAELLQEVVAVTGPQAIAKGLDLQLVLPTPLPKSVSPKSGPDLSVQGDPHRLTRLLMNLLANAVKYTPTGGKIQVAAARHGRQVVVTVTDTGIGIAPERLPLIFERFWRADGARTAGPTGGAGLGLAIAQAIAEEHGGRISVTSQLGEGELLSGATALLGEAPVREASVKEASVGEWAASHWRNGPKSFRFAVGKA